MPDSLQFDCVMSGKYEVSSYAEGIILVSCFASCSAVASVLAMFLWQTENVNCTEKSLAETYASMSVVHDSKLKHADITRVNISVVGQEVGHEKLHKPAML